MLVARDEARLEAVADELRSAYGVEVEVLPADLGDRGPAGPASSTGSPTATGRSTCWSTTPASASSSRFLDNDIEEEQGMLDVLVTAVLRLTHAALGPMTERGSRPGRQRLERRGVPAARHLQRREGLGEQLQRVGAPGVRRPRGDR